MDQKYTNDTMFQYYKGLDDNLAWSTQKLKNQNVTRETLLFPPHTVNAIEL